MPKPLSVGPGTTIGPEHLPGFLQPEALRALVVGVLAGDVNDRGPTIPDDLDLTLLAEAAMQ